MEEISLKVIIILLSLSFLAAYIIGFRLKIFLIKHRMASESIGLGTLEGALLSLFAFFLAFTFSMSAERFNERRHAIVEEANDISTATLRIELYPAEIQSTLRSSFKEYLETRIDYYKAGRDKIKINAALAQTDSIGRSIWELITADSVRLQNREATLLMIPAVNSMLDSVTTRDAVKNAKVPESIIDVLLILGICSAFIVGYGMKNTEVNYIIAGIFVLMISISITLIIDLDRSRSGLINMDQSNEKIIELRSLFK